MPLVVGDTLNVFTPIELFVRREVLEEIWRRTPHSAGRRCKDGEKRHDDYGKDGGLQHLHIFVSTRTGGNIRP
jgi:hypothetical protein